MSQLVPVVRTALVAVRAAPSVDAKLLAARLPGERVIVAEVVDGWAKLDLRGERKRRAPAPVAEGQHARPGIGREKTIAMP